MIILLSGASADLITSIVPQHVSDVCFRGMQLSFYPASSPDIGHIYIYVVVGPVELFSSRVPHHWSWVYIPMFVI